MAIKQKMLIMKKLSHCSMLNHIVNGGYNCVKVVKMLLILSYENVIIFLMTYVKYFFMYFCINILYTIGVNND